MNHGIGSGYPIRLGRRTVLLAGAAIVLPSSVARVANAQAAYPDKPLRVTAGWVS